MWIPLVFRAAQFMPQACASNHIDTKHHTQSAYTVQWRLLADQTWAIKPIKATLFVLLLEMLTNHTAIPIPEDLL